MDDMTFESVVSLGSGGGFYVENWADATMDNLDVQLSEAPTAGSFMYSVSPNSNI